MENEVHALRDGVVAGAVGRARQPVGTGQVICVVAPEADAERRPFCSDVSRENAEPLAATASRVDHWILRRVPRALEPATRSRAAGSPTR